MYIHHQYFGWHFDGKNAYITCKMFGIKKVNRRHQVWQLTGTHEKRACHDDPLWISCEPQSLSSYHLRCSCISETRRFAAEKSWFAHASHICVAFYFFLWLNLSHTLQQIYNVWQRQDPHQCRHYSRIIQLTADHAHSGTPDANVSQRQTPNKDIVSQIELAFICISCKYRWKGADASS